MRRVALVALIGVAATAGVIALGMWSKPPRPEDPPEKKFPVGKATTVADGPLDKDGYVDYEAALNERLGKGITPEKNANVLLWKAMGPRPEGGKGMPPEYFQALGIPESPDDGDYFVGTFRFVNDNLQLEQGKREEFNEQYSGAAKRPWGPKDYPLVAAWLAANEKPLAGVVEAWGGAGETTSTRFDRGERRRTGRAACSVSFCRTRRSAGNSGPPSPRVRCSG
jgi:hypothetical protein